MCLKHTGFPDGFDLVSRAPGMRDIDIELSVFFFLSVVSSAKNSMSF